ncbi:hypothetical protein [Olsenella uli]|uniref:hypothetical protein n=1 Tax=Olsenella uli TaxID=133926 RepID=UPI0028E3CB19|nr:hypothetical protein [Olsenella uli]
MDPQHTNISSGDDDPDKTTKKSLFEDFSMTAVVASALASVTSFALSSKIGLAGSLIGVGIAAAASAIASQVYKSVLSASAEKIKGLGEQGPGMTDPATPTVRLGTHGPDAGGTVIRRMPDAAPGMPGDEPTSPAMAETGTPIAPEAIRTAAADRRSRTIRRRALIVTAVAAIAAVLVYAAIVSLATAGQGIGSSSVVAPTVSEPRGGSSSDATTDRRAEGAGGSSTGQDGTGGSDAEATSSDEGSSAGSSATSGSGTSGSSASGTSGSPDSKGDGTGGATTTGGSSSDTTGSSSTGASGTTGGSSDASSTGTSGTSPSGSGSSKSVATSASGSAA